MRKERSGNSCSEHGPILRRSPKEISDWIKPTVKPKKPPAKDDETKTRRKAMPETVNLNTMITLQAFRMVNAGLSTADKQLAISQALILFDEIYAHLPLKQSMHAVDPVQRLKVLTQRPGEIEDENEFHRNMLETFNSVQDLHTNYLLPDPYRTTTAFLPFMVDEYYDSNGFPHYPVVRIMPQAIQRPFEVGVEITHWNGMPMVTAVALNAT